MIKISIEQAYDEACQALGEEVVKGRIMSKALDEAQQIINAENEAKPDEAIEDPTPLVGKDPHANANGNGHGDASNLADTKLTEVKGGGSEG